VGCPELTPGSPKVLKELRQDSKQREILSEYIGDYIKVSTHLSRGRSLENRLRISMPRCDYSTTDYVMSHLTESMTSNK
jgi:hypothetical protein